MKEKVIMILIFLTSILFVMGWCFAFYMIGMEKRNQIKYDLNHDGQITIIDYTMLQLQQEKELEELRDIILEVDE